MAVAAPVSASDSDSLSDPCLSAIYHLADRLVSIETVLSSTPSSSSSSSTRASNFGLSCLSLPLIRSGTSSSSSSTSSTASSSDRKEPSESVQISVSPSVSSVLSSFPSLSSSAPSLSSSSIQSRLFECYSSYVDLTANSAEVFEKFFQKCSEISELTAKFENDKRNEKTNDANSANTPASSSSSASASALTSSTLSSSSSSNSLQVSPSTSPPPSALSNVQILSSPSFSYSSPFAVSHLFSLESSLSSFNDQLTSVSSLCSIIDNWNLIDDNQLTNNIIQLQEKIKNQQNEYEKNHLKLNTFMESYGKTVDQINRMLITAQQTLESLEEKIEKLEKQP